MLIIKNLAKKFGDKTILKNISASIPTGSIAIFLGSSGTGKSTLLRALNNLETIDAGSVELDGRPINLATVNKTHTIGMVFQQFNLFDHLSAADNIALSLEKSKGIPRAAALKRAHELLTTFELTDKADKYPHQLSGGQKQRLAIARTIALEPRVLCMDEPTSALDPLLTNAIAQLINGLAQKGLTILIATHDTALVDKLQAHIFLMDHGAIVEKASTKDFAQHPEQFPLLNKFVNS